MLRKYAFFNFSAKYFGNRDAKLPKGWEPGDDVVNEFRAFLEGSEGELHPGGFRSQPRLGEEGTEARDVHHRVQPG